ncbi:MAG: zinc-dependent metalloprotease [Candidatus Dormibacteraceae bacterium]
MAGVAVGAVAYALVDAVRPRPGTARIIDWDEIRNRARARLSESDALSPRRLRTLEASYRALAAELQGPLLEFVGGMKGELPEFAALDSFGWVDLNVGIMSDALEPLLEVQAKLPNSRALELGRGVLDRYAAVILGFLGRRVLGQYDPQLLGREPAGRPGLYLVEPNIVRWEEDEFLPGEALRRWLILHEMTHAWQFGAHPWLRDHINSMIREVLGAAMDRQAGNLDRLLALTVGVRGQLAVLSRVQSTMSLIEGYSNLVMDRVGRSQLPEFEVLERAHEERSGHRSLAERIFWRVTGLDLKLQQYIVGERFCKEVESRHGMALLNRAWEGPDQLPTAEELREPERWAKRMGSPG